MKKYFLLLLLLPITYGSFAQNIAGKLATATARLAGDPQLSNANFGFYVADGLTGKTVFDYNGNKGLSPASSQKIFTAIAAYELLGSDYRFKTTVGYRGEINDGVLNGNLIITGYGDPTLGSWRYNGYKPEDFRKKLFSILSRAGIRAINGNVLVDDSRFGIQPIPGGWSWGDIGNYYGASCWGINWNENQFDILFSPGAHIGDTVSIRSIKPTPVDFQVLNRVTTGEAGSGDQSTIYLGPYVHTGIANGTVAMGKDITVSGTFPNPPAQLAQQLQQDFRNNNFYITGNFETANSFQFQNKPVEQTGVILDTLYSPSMDSIVYYFLQRSINLYGESFAKIIGWEKTGNGETDEGVQQIRAFWQKQDIAPNALRMIDGSGLSPQNYVAPSSEVKALLYAQKRPWYPAFYKALPLYNGTKMKSGTINSCKAFTGYQTAADGKKYVFSLIINNYNGSSSALVQKMYTLLNNLK